MQLSVRYLVAAFVALGAAGLLPVHDAAAQPAGRGFVRLDPIEDKAAPNGHPAPIAEDLLRAALAAVRTGASLSRTTEPVFDEKELGEVVPKLAAALGRASPAQDASFAVFGHHGNFGENSPATVTTARVFVEGRQLNLIFGLVQARYDDGSFSGPVELTPGRRARPVGNTWALGAEGAKTRERRSDWLVFDLASLGSLPKPAEAAQEARPPARPAAAASPAPIPAAKPDAADARYQEIQSRLKTLDRLRADGLITEDEYRERRRAILQSI